MADKTEAETAFSKFWTDTQEKIDQIRTPLLAETKHAIDVDSDRIKLLVSEKNMRHQLQLK